MQYSITADTRVQEALCRRPLIAQRLEAFKSGLWDRPEAPLREVFADMPGILDSLLREIEHVPVPAAETHWREHSAAHLLDHLARDHREFFGEMLADIEHLFGVEALLDPEIHNLHGLFQGFVGVLRLEIEAEESRLFHRVLRYEACLRNPGVHPAFNDGSLRVAVAYRNSLSADHHEGEIRNLIGKIRETDVSAPEEEWPNPLAQRLEEFLERFLEHERLESEVLFPMATEMEKTLYNLSIDGSRSRSFRTAAAG